MYTCMRCASLAFNPRAVMLTSEAETRKMSNPGTPLSKSGRFVAPERLIASAVIIVVVAGALASGNSLLAGVTAHRIISGSGSGLTSTSQAS